MKTDTKLENAVKHLTTIGAKIHLVSDELPDDPRADEAAAKLEDAVLAIADAVKLITEASMLIKLY